MQYQLGEEGRQYVLARIGTGLTLSQGLLKLRRAGRIWAYLPEPVPSIVQRDLERGGLGHRADRRARLLDSIARHLEQGPTACAIVEDYLAKPGDPTLARGEVPYAVHRDEVYDYLVGGQPRDRIEALIAAGRSYRLTLVLSEVPGDLEPEVRHSLLLAIAQAATTVILDAWHNEGEVFCELEGPSPVVAGHRNRHAKGTAGFAASCATDVDR